MALPDNRPGLQVMSKGRDQQHGSPIDPRVDEIFFRAQQLQSEKQAAYLLQACGGDTTILRNVETLLAAAESSERYFDELAARLGVSNLFAGDLSPEEQRVVGTYRIVRLLGRGGMGAVYLAERADQQFEKQVALKVLPVGLADAGARARFLAERQLLARLVHPNIARLLDGGVTPEGTPYFVMDYVDGQPIDAHCARLRLTVRERLRLFRQVCDAVGFAHRNLIVHRDLKPANVLIDEAGNVRLLDFGIGKLLSDVPAQGSPLTEVSGLALTPDYASPEQILGEPLAITADVYSLGVLLYELLTGERPYKLKRNSRRALEDAILQVDPLKPSDAAPPERRKTLRGDLDRILFKVLEKAPDARYTSVDALSEDIDRFLAGRPVLARQGGQLYRIGKFARRRRGLVIAGALTAAMLAVIAVQTASFAVTTARQAEAIARERDVSTEITDFLLSVFAVSDPNQAKGETITARELLDRGADRVRTELQSQPATRAVLTSAIAKVYAQLGLYDRTKPLLEEALSLHREVSGEISEEFVAVLEDHTEFAQIMGDYATAESRARRVMGIRRQLADPRGIAGSMNALGRVLHLQGDYDAAEPYYREALARYRSIYGEEHETVALSLSHLGALAAHQGQVEIATELQRKALSIRRKLYGDEHLSLIGSLNNLADLSQNLGSYEEAILLYNEALTINRKLLPEDHADNAYLYGGLGVVHRKLGNYDKAEANYRKSIELREKSVGREHPEVGTSLANLAKLQLVRGDPAGAVPVYREAYEILSRTLPDDPYVYAVQSRYGRSLGETTQYADAEKEILAGYQGLLDAYGPNHRWTREASENLVQLYEAWGKPGEADQYRVLLTGK